MTKPNKREKIFGYLLALCMFILMGVVVGWLMGMK